MDIIYSESFTHKGREFSVDYVADADTGPPWEHADGHGIIREGYESDKRPGWRKLAPTGSRDVWRFYDVQETMKIALRDGWDAEPHGKWTAGERAARAVEEDFKFLRAWCDNQWQYVGVLVRLMHKDGTETAYRCDVWAVESWKDYHLTVARELADECVRALRAAAREKAKETRERNYWAARDVVTR